VLIGNFFVCYSVTCSRTKSRSNHPDLEPATHFRASFPSSGIRYGIFKGEPNPYHISVYKVHSMQSMTYAGHHAAALPLQFYTGCCWDVSASPAMIDLSGACGCGHAHVLIFIFFVGFIFIHPYLATSATPARLIQGMLTGYEEVEDEPATAPLR